jgi:hypothetical protein
MVPCLLYPTDARPESLVQQLISLFLPDQGVHSAQADAVHLVYECPFTVSPLIQ